MTLFSQRSAGYKAGLIVILLASKMALYGVIAPGWYTMEPILSAKVSLGLWFTCVGTFSDCEALDWEWSGAYLSATKVFAIVGMVSLLIAYVAAIAYNCCIAVDIRRRTIEWFSIKGAISLFVACMVSVAEKTDQLIFFNYGPSFAVTLTASILALIGGILVAVSNHPLTSYAHLTVGISGVQTVKQQYGQPCPPEQPANIFYTSPQVSYTSNSY